MVDQESHRADAGVPNDPKAGSVTLNRSQSRPPHLRVYLTRKEGLCPVVVVGEVFRSNE